MTPPLVKGGQGRSASTVFDSAVIVVVALAFAALVAVGAALLGSVS